jgi:AcrR family transcriptional regulator
MAKTDRPVRTIAERRSARAAPTGRARRRSRERPARPVPDGDTERLILGAARRVFVRRGTAGARMQEIAAEAGVNQALLHYYFRSKDALAHAVFREAAQQLFPALIGILGSSQPLKARITQVVHHYIDALREHPYLPGYVLAEINFDAERIPLLVRELGDAQREARAAMLARLDKDLARRARAGEIRPIRAAQFIANVAALCVFPFAARPMIAHLLSVADWDYFLDARRRDLPSFILNALSP